MWGFCPHKTLNQKLPIYVRLYDDMNNKRDEYLWNKSRCRQAEKDF